MIVSQQFTTNKKSIKAKKRCSLQVGARQNSTPSWQGRDKKFIISLSVASVLSCSRIPGQQSPSKPQSAA
jgi:hypothetical protein